MVPALLVYKLVEDSKNFDLDGVDLQFAPWTVWLVRLTAATVVWAAQGAGLFFLLHDGPLAQRPLAASIFCAAFLALVSSLLLAGIGALAWSCSGELRRWLHSHC